MNKPTIKSASIARISDKIGSLIGWLVKSNHSETSYLVRCKKVGSRCFWLCDCKAQEFGYNGFGYADDCWLNPEHAQNNIYRMLNRQGKDTTKIAGF